MPLRLPSSLHVLWQHKQGSEFFVVDSREWVEVHVAMVHRCVNRGRFGERALTNDEPQEASTRVASKTLVCFHMKQEVFKMVGVHVRNKQGRLPPLEHAGLLLVGKAQVLDKPDAWTLVTAGAAPSSRR